MTKLKRIMGIRTCAVILTVLTVTGAIRAAIRQQPRSNPFSPSSTTAKYERVREYDLRNVLLRLTVDWERKQFGGNADRGLPTHLATIVLLDPETGALQAVMDGRYITEARTAAVSAVSVRHLARPQAAVPTARGVRGGVDVAAS